MTNKFRIAFIFLVILWLPLTEVLAENDANRYYKQGNLSAKSNNNEEALKYFDLSIKEDPDFYKAHRNKGVALFMLGKYRDALLSLDKAIEMNPAMEENFAIHALKANAYAYLNEPAKAIKHAKKSLLLNNQESVDYNLKGIMLGLLGKYTEAIESYDKAIALGAGSFETYKNKFCPLYKLKRYEEAIKSCDQALTLEPDNSGNYELYANKALALNKLKKYKESIVNINRALELRPNYQLAIKAKNDAMTGLNE